MSFLWIKFHIEKLPFYADASNDSCSISWIEFYGSMKLHFSKSSTFWVIQCLIAYSSWKIIYYSTTKPSITATRNKTWIYPLRREKWSVRVKRHAKAFLPESSKGCERLALGIIYIPRLIEQVSIKGAHSYSLSS